MSFVTLGVTPSFRMQYHYIFEQLMHIKSKLEQVLL